MEPHRVMLILKRPLAVLVVVTLMFCGASLSPMQPHEPARRAQALDEHLGAQLFGGWAAGSRDLRDNLSGDNTRLLQHPWKQRS